MCHKIFQEIENEIHHLLLKLILFMYIHNHIYILSTYRS